MKNIPYRLSPLIFHLVSSLNYKKINKPSSQDSELQLNHNELNNYKANNNKIRKKRLKIFHLAKNCNY